MNEQLTSLEREPVSERCGVCARGHVGSLRCWAHMLRALVVGGGLTCKGGGSLDNFSRDTAAHLLRDVGA